METRPELQQPDSEGINWKYARMSVLAPEKKKKSLPKYKGNQKPTIKTETTQENIALLETARRWYDSLNDFRNRRRRVRKYLRGDQWHELVPDPDNPDEMITEEALIRNQGRVPLKQNILAQIKNNIIGRFRQGQMKPIVVMRDKDESKRAEMLSNALRAAHDLNKAKELDARNFEEFVMSGMPIQKIGYKYWKTRDREDAFVANVNPQRIFFNTDIQDVRMSDIRMIGEIVDTTIDEMVSVFARNKADEQIIRSWYAGYGSDITGDINNNGLSAMSLDNLHFYLPNESNKVRLIELWYLKSEWRTYAHDYLTGEYYITEKSLEEIDMKNDERVQNGIKFGLSVDEIPVIDAERKYEQFWYVKYLTIWGHCLYEGESPYAHQEHPYVLKAHPLVDGDVWGMFEDFIDNQRYINRLINMMDMIIGASAKGVLLVPEEAIPDDMDLDDISDEWSKFNGVIKLKVKAGQQMPQQVTASSVNVGVSDMLQLQMKLLQEISGVNYAIQGQRASSSTPASLYAQEAANSALNSKDIMEVYNDFIQQRDYKLLKVIHQFYKEKRMLAIAGDYYAEEAKEYDPEEVRDLDFDLTVSQTIDTPTFKQVTDEFMLRLLEGQLIDLDMFLEHSNMPFAQAMLETLKQKREAMEQAQAGQPTQEGGLPPELQGQPQINPGVENLMGRMLQKPA